MDKFFNSAYRGDPGVPHSGPDRFVNVWIGSIAFSVLAHFNPYMWQLTNQQKFFETDYLSITVFDEAAKKESGHVKLRCWHDKAMLYEQYHWKKAMAKKKPYNFQWNQMDKEVRESYYYNWPVYFP